MYNSKEHFQKLQWKKSQFQTNSFSHLLSNVDLWPKQNQYRVHLFWGPGEHRCLVLSTKVEKLSIHQWNQPTPVHLWFHKCPGWGGFRRQLSVRPAAELYLYLCTRCIWWSHGWLSGLHWIFPHHCQRVNVGEGQSELSSQYTDIMHGLNNLCVLMPGSWLQEFKTHSFASRMSQH